nr:MAG TPA: hypothetical protein [Caudoviricetes sp.]
MCWNYSRMHSYRMWSGKSKKKLLHRRGCNHMVFCRS